MNSHDSVPSRSGTGSDLSGRLERTSAQICFEIESEFGFLPPFFAPALTTPRVLENLWQQTLFAYIDNPLPVRFKEQLFAHLSRYCAVPYCVICHSCALRPLSMSAQEMLALLESPTPTQEDVHEQLQELSRQDWSVDLPESDCAFERSLLYCASFIFLEEEGIERVRSELRRLLGVENYQYLCVLLAYIKTCHMWVEAHPELTQEADKRAQEHLEDLLASEPALRAFFDTYTERFRRERHQRAAQKAMVSAEAVRRRFLELVEGLDAIVVDGDAATLRFSFVSQRAEALLGYPVERWLNEPEFWANLVHPDDLELTAAYCRTEVSQGRNHNVDYRVIAADGRVVWLRDYVTVIVDEMGQPQRLLGVMLDITEQKYAEEATRHSEHRFRMLFDAAVDAILIVDDEYCFVDANPAACKLLGLPRDRILECHITDFIAGGGQAGLPGWKAFLEQGEQIGKVCLSLPNGIKRIAEYSARAHFLPGCHLVSLRDVTQREHTRQELRDSEARFRRLVESNLIGIIFIDADGGITETNNAFLEMVGYTRADLEAGLIPWRDMTPSEHCYLDEQAATELRSAGVCTPYEKEYIRKDGTHVPVLLGAALLEGSGQNGIGFVLNLSERKRAEEHRVALERTRQLEAQIQEMLKLDLLKDEFLSTVSHELRTPLTNIKLAAHMLEQAPQQQDYYLQILKKECKREIKLINDLLDFQRLEAGFGALQPEAIVLEEWLPPLMEPFHLLAQQRGQFFSYNVEPDLPALVSDRSSLERIITELVNNACKYTPSGSAIAIEVRYSTASTVWLSVCNSGVEIPAAEQSRIFEKFYRLPGNAPWEQSGTGLGLGLVAKLVQQLAGTIQVDSRANRTAFLVELPWLLRIDEPSR
ncbi:MAG: PAS domain S-box protein [Gemmatimonadaceae bacterium]|nr:PAS domain S-box protein [Gloeobacterales cyanobacterium ES-bin-141]